MLVKVLLNSVRGAVPIVLGPGILIYTHVVSLLDSVFSRLTPWYFLIMPSMFASAKEFDSNVRKCFPDILRVTVFL